MKKTPCAVGEMREPISALKSQGKVHTMMQKRRAISILAAVALAGLTEQGLAGPVSFEVGGGLVISPDYHDTMKDAYPDASLDGGYGWLDLHIGLPIEISDKFSIRPGVDFWVNAISAPDEDYVNTMILPSVKGRLKFTTESSFYIEAGVQAVVPDCGSDEIEYSSGGVGYLLGIGYEFRSGLSLGLSYVYAPVDVELDDGTELDTSNFGGGMFQIIYAF